MLLTVQQKLECRPEDQAAMACRLRNYVFKSLPNPRKKAAEWLRKHSMDCVAWASMNGPRLHIQTGFKLDLWRHYLTDYDDKIIVDLLEYGWPVSYLSSQLPFSMLHNHPSTRQAQNPTFLREYISKELQN